MDYEKKYKEAQGWIEKIYPTLQHEQQMEAEAFFPELKESENEKIRKAIHIYLDWLDGRKDCQPKGDYTIKDMIAWLEKQGEQKPIINVPPRDVILSIWDLGNEWKELTNGCISTEYGTQLDYIQKHWRESEYYLREKQGEQKPQRMISAEAKEAMYAKPAWSEEDEVKINRIVACLENLNVADNDILLKDVDWLKSLKPQNRWKPTKQQLSELRCVISGCSFETSVLVELEKNLKKLL